MKQFFSSRRASLLTRGYRVTLVVTLLVVTLIFAASSFSPAAYASSASTARASAATASCKVITNQGDTHTYSGTCHDIGCINSPSSTDQCIDIPSAAISGQANPSGPMVTVWANATVYSNTSSEDNYRCVQYPSTSCPVVGQLSAGTQIAASCQYWGQTVSDAGYTNNYWMYVIGSGNNIGWISNIYIIGGQRIRGIPNCNFKSGFDE